MEIPSVDPSAYCRLCFSDHQLQWLLQSSDDPMVSQIQTFLAVELCSEVDFPCTVCRMCSTVLETFDALRHRAMACDNILKNHRLAAAASNDLDIVECKIEPEECASSEMQTVICETLPTSVEKIQSDKVAIGTKPITDEGLSKETANLPPKTRKAGPKIKINYRPDRQVNTCEICMCDFYEIKSFERHMKIKHTTSTTVGRLRQPQKRPGEFKPISPKDIRKQMEKERPAAAVPVPPVPLNVGDKNNSKHPEFINCTIGIPPKFAREKVHANELNEVASDDLRFSKQKPAEYQ